jgi:hypothetical protein
MLARLGEGSSFGWLHLRLAPPLCQVPTIVEQAKAALAEGHCVVIGMQTTGEAAAEALNLEPGCACGCATSLTLVAHPH